LNFLIFALASSGELASSSTGTRWCSSCLQERNRVAKNWDDSAIPKVVQP